MGKLSNKRIVLGISGGIAAYKSAELTRLLKKAGAEVRVVMTQSAQEFITPLTLQALSGNQVHTQLFDLETEAAMGHIELARWADAIVIAPGSANTIARLAMGRGDDLLSTLCLATEAPVLIAPAMNHKMWSNPATQDNLATLSKRSIHIIGPASGEQACGETGVGRMEEPEKILLATERLFQNLLLAGQHVVITAGPTREPIDPVRYISNHSSGKMGYAIARAAHEAGARVTLVSGPVSIESPDGVNVKFVETAEQMLEACKQATSSAQVFIATAAVADYRVIDRLSQKQKKTSGTWSLELTRNPDILAEMAAIETLFTVGFAAETQNLLEYAKDKLKRKGLDMIAANLVGEGRGFGQDENALEVLTRNGMHISLPVQDKQKLARSLVKLIAEALPNNDNIIDLHHAKN
jgi:phosphopantothenoylcysteine decarboxylase/phosphopantothenate--cysteine ligase